MATNVLDEFNKTRTARQREAAKRTAQAWAEYAALLSSDKWKKGDGEKLHELCEQLGVRDARLVQLHRAVVCEFVRISGEVDATPAKHRAAVSAKERLDSIYKQIAELDATIPEAHQRHVDAEGEWRGCLEAASLLERLTMLYPWLHCPDAGDVDSIDPNYVPRGPEILTDAISGVLRTTNLMNEAPKK